MNVCVVGLGYIGLPTALSLSANGIRTIGVDINPHMVETLRNGELTFKEEGMSELFARAKENGIVFSNVHVPADLYIIAVATPYDTVTHKVDASYVTAAISDVLKVCPKDAVIVVESTIPPGTIDRFVRPIIEQSGVPVRIAHAPERIIPGNMLYEIAHNARVIGADDEETGALVQQVYQSFCHGNIVITDIRTAEMSKVVENTFRDINIAFANELIRICREGGLDGQKIISIANMHPRVNILQPGPGVGGHCISVDPWFLVGDYPETSRLIRTAREVNDSMPAYVLERIRAVMSEIGLTDFEKVGLYGLSYKENVDDVRESPTLRLMECLEQQNIHGVRVFDPMIDHTIVPGQMFDFDCFLDGLSLVVILVSHTHIRENADKLASLAVLDTRFVLSGSDVYRL